VPQSLHAASPAPILYFPVAHAMHVPPFGPVCPALHRQLAIAVLAAAELEDAGQLTQEISCVTP
jgi:hypothetical protein